MKGLTKGHVAIKLPDLLFLMPFWKSP